MDAILHTIGEALRAVALWGANGCLALLYTAYHHLPALITAGGCAALLWLTPAGRQRPQFSGQRPWLLAIAALIVVAAFVTQPPAPLLLAVMACAGAATVYADRFNPEALRWRVAGGLALYAAAALGALLYGLYLNTLDAQTWAQALGGQGEAAATLAQGRAFVNTLGTWGLWLILPLAYFSLLGQGLLVHPPLAVSPEQAITAIRTRGQDR